MTMRMRPAILILVLLATCGFSLGTWLVPARELLTSGTTAGGFVAAVMGESRRLLANHLFVQADVYFHAGYYPSVFDQVDLNEGEHMLSAAAGGKEGHQDAGEDPGHGTPGHVHKEPDHAHEVESHHDGDDAGFLGLPLDPIDRLSRHFYPSQHLHAEGRSARELLPWLKLSAEVDPQNVSTYVVAAFWLRGQLGKVDEAEQFLREGWRQNPDSPEILLELGRVFFENRKDPFKARNVWELAARKWQANEKGKKDPDLFLWERIAANLAELEELAGNFGRAATWLAEVQPLSPNPEVIQKRIEVLKGKAAGAGR